MKTKKIKLSLELATKMYNGNDEQLKQLALDNYPELGLKVTDRVKTFLDACKELGEAGDLVKDLLENPVNLSSDEIAYKKLKVIVEALNEGWQPNWDNSSERKYYPYFRLSASGVGFSYYGYGCAFAFSSVGSRLVFKNDELAMYAGKQFKSLYKDFMTI